MVKIIAEVGKNFIDVEWEETPEQILVKAMMLVTRAKLAGADTVKFQTHVFEDEQHKRDPSRYEWIKRNERATPIEFWEIISKFTKENGLNFLTTPMSKMAAEKVNHLVDEWKIGSADIVDKDLLEYIASTNKPIIISSGMSTLQQVLDAVYYLDGKGCSVSILHCVSIYPCPLNKLNLNTITYLKRILPHHRIGFSDHSLSSFAPAMAVAMGAEIIEKHFTFDRKAFGPDHKASLLPREFKGMVQNIHMVTEMLGAEDKLLLDEEVEYWEKFRK